MDLEALMLKIRRRDTPVGAALYRLAASLRALELPTVRPVHRALYYERRFRLTAWSNLKRVLYHEPLFRARCERVGVRLHLDGGIPLIIGHLRLRLGDDVRISGTTTFSAASRAEEPVLEIGDHAYVGYQVTISVGARVSLGRYVLVANRVFLAGDDGHPLDPVARRSQPGSGRGTIIVEDDAWIGESAIVLKDVRIGEGAVVAAAAVVTADVPPFTVVAGNPARVVREIPRAVERG
jgi:acetyltransferase-like isoleucine patch superfamily enzyme